MLLKSTLFKLRFKSQSSKILTNKFEEGMRQCRIGALEIFIWSKIVVLKSRFELLVQCARGRPRFNESLHLEFKLEIGLFCLPISTQFYCYKRYRTNIFGIISISFRSLACPFTINMQLWLYYVEIQWNLVILRLIKFTILSLWMNVDNWVEKLIKPID